MNSTLKRAWSSMGTGSTWVLAGGMSVVAGIRLFRSDSTPVLIGIQAVTTWLLVPAYPLAAIALIRRRPVLGLVAVALSIAQAGWMSTAIGWHGPQPAPSGALTVRLVTANVLLDNPKVQALGDDLARSGADVVVLQEITPANVEHLRAGGLFGTFPYQVIDALPGFHGSAIFSRFPVTAGHPIDVAGYPMTQADLSTPAGPLRVIDVHVVAPLTTPSALRWQAQLAQLSRMQAPAGGPLVLAGDFNATVDHAPLQQLTTAGFRDAFEVAGRGYGATWPHWTGPTVPVMRLDHVMVSQQITVVRIDESVSQGSDHLRLAVELALPRVR